MGLALPPPAPYGGPTSRWHVTIPYARSLKKTSARNKRP